MTATWLTTDRLRVKGAWGQYHQFVNRADPRGCLSGQSRVLGPVRRQPPCQSPHRPTRPVGAAYQTNRLLIDAEVFSRDDLQPLTAGATIDRVDGLRRSQQFFYAGSGRAKGVELLGQLKRGRHSGWASYTWSRVTYDFPELSEPYPADHDRTHEIKLVDVVNRRPMDRIGDVGAVEWQTLHGARRCGAGRVRRTRRHRHV